MSDTFTCESCGRTFTKGWSDEESAAEAAGAFTDAELEDPAVVCDGCWDRMRTAMPDLADRYGGEKS